MSLVTYTEASEHLRLDQTTDRDYVESLVAAASAAIIEYLKLYSAPYQIEVDSENEPVLDSNDEPVVIYDSNGDPIPKPQVKAACLQLVGILYRHRDDAAPAGLTGDTMPPAVRFMLYNLRDPQLK